MIAQNTNSSTAKSLEAYMAITTLFDIVVVVVSIALLSNVFWPGSIPTILLNAVALAVIVVTRVMRRAFLARAKRSDDTSAPSPTD